ncbi:MAG: cytochrome c [Sphaerospermopsis sp. SIO1G2]|nr:cytochrome c [Sphaerospermopsis sp. SIO1G1]NET69712.1 cytochrome c [Sphaerospermopsis sp. SIO1G2]
MDKQLIKLETLTQWIALSVLSIIIVIALVIFGVNMVQASDPYIKDVISLAGNPSQGKAIFLTNCAGCHGSEANGFVGPSLQDVSKRKSKYGLINQVISGETPPMPKFQPNPQEMADLLSYLQNL